MARRAPVPLSSLLLVLCMAACGSGFSSASGVDGGGDSSGGPGDAGTDGSGGDATSNPDAPTVPDAPSHADGPSAPDAPSVDAFPDVVDEPPPPTCAGAFACVPAAPAGWEGPLEVYRGSTAAPACSADFAGVYDGNDSLGTVPPATCSCGCGLSPTTCSAEPLGYTTTALCSNATPCFSTTLTPGACTTETASQCLTTGVIPLFISSAAPAPTSPDCAAQPGKTLPPVQWGIDGRACAPTVALAQVDCKGGSVCAPVPAAPYDPNLCVLQAGDASCPSGPYSNRQVLYGAVDDTRGCSSCTCGKAAGGSCAASYSVYSSSDGSCSGQPDTYGAPFQCAGVDNPADFRLTITPSPGSCSPSSVSPTGGVQPAGPTTVCCLQ
ncbi:MAG TPA: hypothetical protein VIY73_06415 [Polyangiaceae bacterium]